MELTRFDFVHAFSARAESFLVAREADHNLLLGICATLARQPDYSAGPPYLAVVTQGAQVVAAAVMTPPHNLVLSHTLTPEALLVLARDLAAFAPPPPGVLGPAAASAAFAQHWHDLTGQTYQRSMAERIYQLEAVQPVPPVPGHLRRATLHDRPLLLDWFDMFSREALGELGGNVARSVDGFLAGDTRGLFLWDTGQPVTMVGHAGPTPNGMRIGPVYTPRQQRRNGYASAAVAALSQQLLDSGRRFCFLFTDLSNPTSNHIYQQIGYRPVCDVDAYRFA